MSRQAVLDTQASYKLANCAVYLQVYMVCFMNHWGSTVRKAVTPAAGWGTRFLPATKAMPNEMLPVVDAPAIKYVVEEAIKTGLSDVLLIAGRSKRTLEDPLTSRPILNMRWKRSVTGRF